MPLTSGLFKYRNVLLLIFVLMSVVGRGTHMIGGYLTYKHLDSNNYEVTLRIYRDCNPNTQAFPLSASIVVEGILSTFNQSFSASKGPTYPHLLDSAHCIVVPPGVCIEYADYIDTIYLPPIMGGYKMHYRTCCRNALISNIPTPLNTGYYYNTTIPSLDSTGNSSPYFVQPPPVLICLNEPLSDTIKFAESDNDSLYYELCDIYQKSVNQPPQIINFNNPFSSSYPIASSPAIGINGQTGELFGTPTQIGHYVMGICVTEYRNGIPLSTVRLDYQFNVTNCTRIQADILTQIEDSTHYCNGLTLNFISQSPMANQFFWDFGDPTTLSDTSSARHPTYTYSKPGQYLVTLIAAAGKYCEDTAVAIFEVKDNPAVNLVDSTFYCFKDLPLSITPTGSIDDSSKFLWDFGPSANYQFSNLENPPPVSWPTGGAYYIELKVTSGNCIYLYGDTVYIRDSLRSDMLTPDERLGMTCNGLGISFVSESVGNNSVFWNFGDLTTLGDTAIKDSVWYTYPAPGHYWVTLIVGQDGMCFDTSRYRIEIFEKIKPEIYFEGQFCYEAQSVDFYAQGTYPSGVNYFWDFGPLANKPTSASSIVKDIQWSAPGIYPISLTVSKNQCTETLYDTVYIHKNTVPVDAGPDQILSWQELLELAGSGGDQFYWWSSHAVIIANPFGQFTSVEVTISGDTITFYLLVTDKHGCQGRDSLKVYMQPETRDDGYNYISPNGDGRNDYLDLSAFISGNDCEFTVINRWGAEVYHAERYDNTWGGTNMAGEQLPDGTYYYILFCDRHLAVKGPITIIRGKSR